MVYCDEPQIRYYRDGSHKPPLMAKDGRFFRQDIPNEFISKYKNLLLRQLVENDLFKCPECGGNLAFRNVNSDDYLGVYDTTGEVLDEGERNDGYSQPHCNNDEDHKIPEPLYTLLGVMSGFWF